MKMSFTATALSLFLLFTTVDIVELRADEGKSVKVGIPTVLSGELALLGQNLEQTIETYKRHYLRHKLEFSFEDSRINSFDGLRAIQKLINADKVDLMIAGCSTNGLVAGKTLINNSRTPTISIVTGGKAADEAGPYVFRIGNSDTLNGKLEAESFSKEGFTRVALFTEETEYTHDIRAGFLPRFKELQAAKEVQGEVVFDDSFSPNTTDFRSQISVIKRAKPQALLILTQTGTALGLFLKQWQAHRGPTIPIHTSFVAAPNPDAHTIAGELIYGVKFMAPAYDPKNPEWIKFLELFEKDHGAKPAIAFHSAGTVDALNLLQKYLDTAPAYSREGFQNFLLSDVKNYHGLMGEFSFDSEGNANTGFIPATIEKSNSDGLQ